MQANNTEFETITLTSAAVDAIKELLEKRQLEGYALRIYVSGGGCSGLQYGMTLDNNIRDLDVSCQVDGVKAVVDEVSIQYLRGATIDFTDDLMGSGFKIENPNAMASCGCGQSFSTSQNENASGTAGGCSGCG